MSSPSHIKLPSVRTAGVATAAAAAPTLVPTETPAVRRPTRRSTRASIGRSSREERATRVNRTVGRPAINSQHTFKRADCAAGHASRSESTGRSARAERAAARTNPATGIIQSLGVLRQAIQAHLLLIAVTAGVVLMVVSVYPSVRDYYVASRDQEVLAARYAELQATNDELMHDIGYLQSVEGIEDEARKRGYILPGETGVSVEGLAEESSEEAAPAAKAPWYQGILDAFFGYEPKEW